MEDNKAPSNVLQFPTWKRKESEAGGQKPQGTPSSPEPKAKKKRSSKKNVAGTVLAIILATGAVNRFAFQSSAQSADMASHAGSNGRAIASVGTGSYERDAEWEKNLAEKLASPQTRNIASVHVGRTATAEEKLRWGTLEEKYTITYKADRREIDTILLQGEGQSSPAYILNRDKFIKDYGTLLESEYASSKLKSVETVNDKTIESFTLFNKEQQAKSEVRFELDRHQRLLSLKVESI